MFNRKVDAISIFMLSLMLFIIGLNSQEIIGFEARFYLFALEMWRYGASWFPTTYHQPYPDYPAASTYLIYLLSMLFGHINKLTAVLPSAVASAMTVAVTYLIAARQSRLWGWAASFFLLFTVTFVAEARTISLDQYVTLMTALCFYVMQEQQLKSVNQASLLWKIGPLLILSFAFRGPIGLVIPTGVLCVSCLVEKNYSLFWRIGFFASILLLICSLSLLALAFQSGGMGFVQDVLRMEVLGRINDVKTLPLTFYFTESLGAYAIAYPLAVLVAIVCLSKKPQEKLLLQCIAWALIILLGLSVPVDKKVRYILPAAPAFALICGYLFVSAQNNINLLRLKKITNLFCFIFPLAALAAIIVLYRQHVQIAEIHYVGLFVLLSLIQLVILFMRKNPLIVLGLAAVTFVSLHILVIEKINLSLNKTRDFVLQVESQRQKTQAALVFYHEGMDGLPIKYLVDMTDGTQPTYIDQENELLKLAPHTFVIVSTENYSRISFAVIKTFHVIFHGKIGHNAVFVLEKVM